MVASPTPTPPQDVRSQILLAATKLFAARGFEATSLQNIADIVGVSNPAVLHHFPSKESLRIAVLNAMVSHWNDALPSLLKAAAAGEDRFDAVVGALWAFFSNTPDRARLVLREILDRPDETTKLLKGGVQPWLDVFADFIRSGQKHNTHSPDVDPQAYVIHVLHLVIAAAASAPVGHAVLGTNAPQRYAQELIRLTKASLFSSSQINSPVDSSNTSANSSHDNNTPKKTKTPSTKRPRPNNRSRASRPSTKP